MPVIEQEYRTGFQYEERVCFEGILTTSFPAQRVMGSIGAEELGYFGLPDVEWVQMV